LNKYDIRWCVKYLPKTYTSILNISLNCTYKECNTDYKTCKYISKVPIYQPYVK